MRVSLSLSFAFFKGDDSNFKYNRNIIVIDCLMQVLWIEFHHFQITWGKLARMWPSPAREWCPCPNQHSCHLDNCDPGANCCDVCRLCSFHCQCSNCECRAYCECRAPCDECLLQLLGTRQLPVWSQLLWARNVQVGTWHPWERLLNSYAMQILSVHCSNKISSLSAHNAQIRLQTCAPCFEHHNTHCSVPHMVILLWAGDVTPAHGKVWRTAPPGDSVRNVGLIVIV